MLGDAYLKLGDFAAAKDAFETFCTLTERAVQRDPSPLNRSDLAVSLSKQATLALHDGKWTRARDLLERSRDLHAGIAAVEPDNLQNRREWAVSLERLGDVVLQLGDDAAAADMYRQALAKYESMNESAQFERVGLAGRSIMITRLADIDVRADRMDAARRGYESALELDAQLIADEPANPQFRLQRAINAERLGDLALERNDLDAAFDRFNLALDAKQQLVAIEPTNPIYLDHLMSVQTRLARLADRRGETDRAAAHYNAAHDAAMRRHRIDPDDPQGRYVYYNSMAPLADAAESAANLDQAALIRADMLDLIDGLIADAPERKDFRHNRLALLQTLIDLHDRRHDDNQCRLMSKRIIDAGLEFVDDDDVNPLWLAEFAHALLNCDPPDLRDPVLAARIARRALERAGGDFPEALTALAEAEFRNGRPAESVAAQRRAIESLPDDAEAAQRLEMTAKLTEYEHALNE
jgi:tetratricopeptide (TPR) repeat protein